ncbi:hypothetical protein Y032_0514g2772 [Ancylostoma ceylanicum]|uniref:Uncharacterized protein n=1 Tax=Ancylostoma ceylanicum TaxID=53326 RepID=A0A016WT88_9BILA|nr:hypothetical protein Y032_0514g2772 [Ancylostoma ceylanicum]
MPAITIERVCSLSLSTGGVKIILLPFSIGSTLFVRPYHIFNPLHKFDILFPELSVVFEYFAESPIDLGHLTLRLHKYFYDQFHVGRNTVIAS